jgi:hypothetical protein
MSKQQVIIKLSVRAISFVALRVVFSREVLFKSDVQAILENNFKSIRIDPLSKFVANTLESPASDEEVEAGSVHVV